MAWLRKYRAVIFFGSIFFLSVNLPFGKNSFQQTSNCNISNTAFTHGEEIVYKIWYNWGFIWLESGEVTFKVKKDEFKGMPCYLLYGVGGTYPKYDWFYKVRDTFSAWVDTANLRTFRFIRNASDGPAYIYEDCYFNYKTRQAFTLTRSKKKMPRLDSTYITGCSYDVLSLIYYSRNIDFSKCNINDTIPLDMFLENKVYPTYLRYLGKDVYEAEGFGKFNCVKFRANLIEGTLFAGGEQMTVWVTDDKNKIPLYIESPILVGSVKAKLMKVKGLKNKMESKIH